MHQISGALIGRKKRHADLLPVAALFAFQALTNFCKSKVFTQMFAQLQQAQACVMAALTAIRTVIVRVIDMSERVAFEPGVFHVATITPRACGLLLYNSYSSTARPLLYGLIGAKLAPVTCGVRCPIC